MHNICLYLKFIKYYINKLLLKNYDKWESWYLLMVVIDVNWGWYWYLLVSDDDVWEQWLIMEAGGDN